MRAANLPIPSPPEGGRGLGRGGHRAKHPPLLLAAAFSLAWATPPRLITQDVPWTADIANGTYRNPIIFADYSDPDVIRVGADYFLTASSFNATPALPILRSRDLVNWTIVGHALPNLPEPRFAAVQPGEGVWAPAWGHHAGRFYIFFPMPDEGIYVLEAPHPTGPWSAPRMLLPGKGLIDPAPFWDDDGRAYLVHAYAKSRSGIKSKLRLRPMSPDTKRLLGEGSIIFDGTVSHPTMEGPKMYKRDGWYYVLAPAGGVPKGWQVALRSRAVYGPYEDRVVLQSGTTSINGPHQGALVDTPGGRQWWFVHFQDRGVYGRIVHLNPVTWQKDGDDGWPWMGVPAVDPVTGNVLCEPVLSFVKPAVGRGQPIAVPQTSDTFDARTLGLQWQWNANHNDAWVSLTAHPGHLRLYAAPAAADLALEPRLLLQKFPAPAFSAETQVEATGAERAGLIVVGKTNATLTIEGAEVRLSINGNLAARMPLISGPVTLKVAVADGGLCRFAAGLPGQPPVWFTPAYQADPGRWIGARVGLFAAGPGGYADFAAFRIAPL